MWGLENKYDPIYIIVFLDMFFFILNIHDDASNKVIMFPKQSLSMKQ